MKKTDVVSLVVRISLVIIAQFRGQISEAESTKQLLKLVDNFYDKHRTKSIWEYFK